MGESVRCHRVSGDPGMDVNPSSRHEALPFSYLLDDRRAPSNVNLI
jgi:hypothetical protein